MLKAPLKSFVWKQTEFSNYTFDYSYFFLSKKKFFSTNYVEIYYFFALRYEGFVEKNVFFPHSFFNLIQWYAVRLFWQDKTITHKNREILFIYIKYSSNTYQGYRHFLCLPCRGQRTWSNHKCQKKKEKVFFNYVKFIFFRRRKKNYCPDDKKSKILYTEFVNFIWKRAFFPEWRFHKYKRLWYAARHRYKPWSFDLEGLLANRICVHKKKIPVIPKKRKVKGKRRADTLSQRHLFNVGFERRFTRYYLKRIFKNFFKRSRYHVEVKKKKKKK